jgi:ATP-dependent RNA helicase DeaD
MNELKERLFKKTVVVEPNDVVVEPVETTESEEVVSTSSTTAETLVLRNIPEKFTTLAADICQNQNAQDVVAGLLSIMYGEKLSPKHYGKISTKDLGPRGDQLRIFVSLGKKDGYRARELAEFFSNLLHIPGRMVDDIDVAQEFSLVSLPAASAKKAIEMSRKNKKLPHMHLDVKEEGGGRKRNTRRHSEDKPREDKQKRPSKKPAERSSKKPSSKKSGNDASAFVKKGKKAERF